jgi:hypothetical protein
MTKHSTRGVVPLLAAASLLLTACSDDTSGATQEESSSTPLSGATAPTGPIDLKTIGAGTSLEPATYAMPLVGDDGPMRALVDVPEGYFSSGGWFIDDGHGELAPDEFGNLSFWGVVGQVDPDPCQGDELLRPGPNVRDLARALVAQRHRTTSGPTQVTVGGFDGLYVESWATGGFEGCRHGKHAIFGGTPGDSLWIQDSIAGTVDRFWILDVHGRRVVATVQTMRGKTAHPDELVHMAASARFIDSL